MFKNEDDLKEAVSRLNIDDNPNPAHRERLREQMLSVFEKTGWQSIGQARPLWRAIMKSPITKLAAAAVLVVAVLWGIHHVGGRDTTSVALASVIDNMKKAPWIQWVTTEYHNGKEAEQHYYWINFSSKKGFYKFKDSFWCFDYDKGKQYHYKSSDETIQVEELSENGFYGTDSAISFVEEFIRWAKSDQFQVTQYRDTLNGEKVEFFELTKSYPDKNMENTACIFNITLIVSQQSQLLVGGGAERRRLDEADKTVTYDWQITYPESGPEDLYALGVPRTAKVIDTREVFVAEVKNEPTLVSTPKPTISPEMAPLPIKLPRPMFVGTPQDIKVANLEKPLGKPRPSFYAPVGTKNIALGKKVTSTDEMPIIGEIEMITDGDKEGSDGSYVEMGPFKQHVTIDLGAEHDIYAIVVWHFHKQPRVYFDVVVQVASEPNFVKPKTLFNNDTDNSMKLGIGKNMHYIETSEGKLIDAKGTCGRYVRLYSQGNTHDDLNHYIEVEVYGKAVTDKPESAPDEKKDQIKSDKGNTEKVDPNTPKTGMAPLQIKLPTPLFIGTPQNVRVPYLKKPLGKPRPPFYAPMGTKNVALGKPVTCTDEEPIIGEIEMITDGDKEGADGSFIELGPSPQSITIDLEAVYDIYAIVVWHYHKEAWVFFDVVVQVADDSDFITNVRTLFNNDIDNSLGLGVGKNMHYTETAEGKLIDAKGIRARYVRLHSNGSTGSDANHYIEVEVYGKAVK
jgi:hypothetical protein